MQQGMSFQTKDGVFLGFFLHDDRWDEEQNVENLYLSHLSWNRDPGGE